MQQNIKDGADYIKLSQSFTPEADALSYMYSARKWEDHGSEVQHSLH